MRRYVLTVVLGIGLALLSAGAALAGGWATTELDEPLPEFAAGGTWLIGFTILQHGAHPAAVDGAGLRFTNINGGEVMFFEAGPQGARATTWLRWRGYRRVPGRWRSRKARSLLVAVEDLALQDREIITYRFFLDLSVAETAQALSIAEGTVKSRLSRALSRLSEHIVEEEHS